MVTIRTTHLFLISCRFFVFVTQANAADQNVESDVPDTPKALVLDVQSIEGKTVNLADEYRGNVVMIVHVASECGHTPQYQQLQELHN